MGLVPVPVDEAGIGFTPNTCFSSFSPPFWDGFSSAAAGVSGKVPGTSFSLGTSAARLAVVASGVTPDMMIANCCVIASVYSWEAVEREREREKERERQMDYRSLRWKEQGEMNRSDGRWANNAYLKK